MNKSAFRILAAGILTFLCVCAGNAAETSVKIAPGRSVIMASRKNRVAICCVSTGLVAAESRDLPRVQRDSESYFGDIAGIEGLLGIKYKKDARK